MFEPDIYAELKSKLENNVYSNNIELLEKDIKSNPYELIRALTETTSLDTQDIQKIMSHLWFTVDSEERFNITFHSERPDLIIDHLFTPNTSSVIYEDLKLGAMLKLALTTEYTDNLTYLAKLYDSAKKDKISMAFYHHQMMTGESVSVINSKLKSFTLNSLNHLSETIYADSRDIKTLLAQINTDELDSKVIPYLISGIYQSRAVNRVIHIHPGSGTPDMNPQISEDVKLDYFLNNYSHIAQFKPVIDYIHINQSLDLNCASIFYNTRLISELLKTNHALPLPELNI